MGTGKSTIGNYLAKELGWTLLDTDTEIETLEKCSIRTLFEEKGEAYFREQETALCQTLSAQSQTIISTGGGIVLNPENIKTLRENGFVVWLKATAATLKKRLHTDQTRPLLMQTSEDDPITTRLNNRAPLYQQTAHFSVDTDTQTPEDIAQTIIDEYTKHL